MYCQKCGAENVEGVQFCQSCSEALDRSETQVVMEPAKTSRLAIASLVCGILSIFTFFIAAIPAIIMGVISLVKINKSKGRQKGLGLAIAGIAIPVILLPILMAILMPALGRVKVLAERLVCGANMKGMANAMNIYQFDYDDKYPTGSKWCDLLMAHAGVEATFFVCPGGEKGRSHYALNENALRLGKDSKPDMVLMFECAPGWNQVGGPELLTTENHKGQGCNVLFVDSHVEFVPVKNLDELRWTLEQGR